MAPDLRALLDGVTPTDPGPLDLESLHRRGLRRRRLSRMAAGAAGTAAVLAAVAVGTTAGAGRPLALDPITMEPSRTASPSPDTSPVVPYLPTAEEVADAAGHLPVPGVAPDARDLATVAAAQGIDGLAAGLRTNEVGCLYARGAGPTPEPPEGARSDRTWTDHAATTDDLVAACIDSDDIRSGEFHAPGPYTVCQGTPNAAVRKEMVEHPGSGAVVDDGGERPPVTFPSLLTWGTDCAGADDSHRYVTVSVAEDPGALMERFNTLRRLEAGVRARAQRECLSPRAGLAMAMATVDRLNQGWAILSDIESGRDAACTDLTFEPHLGVITLWPARTH